MFLYKSNDLIYKNIRLSIFSNSIVLALNFGANNTFHYNYGLLTNSDNHLSQHDIEVFDGTTFVEYINYSKYYYQGDVLP